MKILTVIGSPKGKGSGYSIAKEVERILSFDNNVSVEFVLLKETNLKMCIGCFQCVKRGIESCPLKDDYQMIEKKIESADGIIFVTPVYVYNVSGLMKNFIDRFAYTNHRPRYFDKKLMLIANAGSGMAETIDIMKNVLGAGPEIVSEVPYLTPEWELKDRVKDKLEKMLKEESLKFYKAIKAGEKSSPDIQDYVRFKLFKKVSVDV